jgi:hypothetical protein
VREKRTQAASAGCGQNRRQILPSGRLALKRGFRLQKWRRKSKPPEWGASGSTRPFAPKTGERSPFTRSSGGDRSPAGLPPRSSSAQACPPG